MNNLWILHETGAMYVFHDEADARVAVAQERDRGLHVEELVTVQAPEADIASYRQAVNDDIGSAHLHPTFVNADNGTYPTVASERLCAAVCSETGDTEACEAATRTAA